LALGSRSTARSSRAADAELQQRVETLEAEMAALKRLVAKLKAKVLPLDLDVA
jgi:uncharacterized protein YceH (UPF0502 family)